MTNIEVTRAYRHLCRAALQAVHFSTPARYQVRDILRLAFRSSSFSGLPSSFNPRRIENTIDFLRRAREYTGIEHKILRNILHARYWRRGAGGRIRSDGERPPPWMRTNDDVGVWLRRGKYDSMDATVAMLNESMDLCLRT